MDVDEMESNGMENAPDGGGDARTGWDIDADTVHSITEGIIDEMDEKPWLFANDPGLDFTRRRMLPFDVLLKFIIGLGGATLPEELSAYFEDNFPKPGGFASVSAYVQQMAKLIPGTMENVFREFNERCGSGPITMDGYDVCAVDGSTLSIARDEDSPSFLEMGKDRSGNQLHLNLIIDLLKPG